MVYGLGFRVICIPCRMFWLILLYMGWLMLVFGFHGLWFRPWVVGVVIVFGVCFGFGFGVM